MLCTSFPLTEVLSIRKRKCLCNHVFNNRVHNSHGTKNGTAYSSPNDFHVIGKVVASTFERHKHFRQKYVVIKRFSNPNSKISHAALHFTKFCMVRNRCTAVVDSLTAIDAQEGKLV